MTEKNGLPPDHEKRGTDVPAPSPGDTPLARGSEDLAERLAEAAKNG